MEENKIVIKKIFDSPIEKVWNAWTKPENLMQWKSPEGIATKKVEVDLKKDGHYAVTMAGEHMATGEMTVAGEYKEIEKPHKLVFSWQWQGQVEITQVTVLLKALSESKTELTLIHKGFETDESRVEHAKGWKSTTDKLEKFLK